MIFILPLKPCAQFYDNIWLLGYDGGSQSPNEADFGISLLNFSNGKLSISDNQDIEMNFNDTNSSICDSTGNLLFYFNGVYIEDSTHQTMLNGDTLNEWNLFGYDLPQGGLILPFPNHQDQYYLLHSEEGYIDQPGWYLECTGLFYSIVDMKENHGLGEVIQRKVPMIIDTLEYGKLTGTKHANGRDWWIVINKSHSNIYYVLLLSDKGLELYNIQEVGIYTPDGLGQAVFSPDGKRYVKFNVTDFESGSFVDIYDFNRCTGYLSNHRQINFNDQSSSGGAAISPNSRYLYVTSSNFIYQYDLLYGNIEMSKRIVAVYDGYENPFPTQFYQAQLAPDGKIYIACKNGSKSLHVINSPDNQGNQCEVLQHAIELPTYNASSIPNFINYRLGPLDGSPCDTLGLDNFPVARFRFEEDQPGWRHDIRFTDLSFYNPQHWSWDFGDGGSSDEIHPVHSFENGLYHVCLTVSNENGSDSICQWVEILPTSLAHEAANPEADISINPNPFTDKLEIRSKSGILRTASLEIFDMHGTRVLNQPKAPEPVTLYLPQLPAGMYLFRIGDIDGTTYQFKVMKI